MKDFFINRPTLSTIVVSFGLISANINGVVMNIIFSLNVIPISALSGIGFMFIISMFAVLLPLRLFVSELRWYKSRVRYYEVRNSIESEHWSETDIDDIDDIDGDGNGNDALRRIGVIR